MGKERRPSHILTVAILLCALGGLIYFLTCRENRPDFFSLAVIFWRRLLVLGGAAIVVGGASAFGARLCGMLIPDAEDTERTVFGAGLGLGLVSLLVLLLGHISTKLVLLVFVLCAIWLISMRGALKVRISIPRDALSKTVVAVLVLLFLFNLTACFMPPIDYDVTEYHLGAPAEYLRSGRMHFLPHNVYSNFPGNMEMLYLLSLSIGGLPFGGAFVAKILNLCLVTLAAAALYCLVKRFVNERAALIAAAALYVHPIATIVAVKAYVEGGLMFYTVLSLFAAVVFARTRSARWAALAGLTAGLAAGCKYTALPLVALPVLVYVAATGRRAASVAVAAACFAAAFSPWAARNLINTRNPVYPLAYGILKGTCWSPEQDARFSKAHHPPKPPEGRSGIIHSTHRFLARGCRFFTNRLSCTPILLVFVPLALIVGLERRVLLHALGYFLLCFTMWFAITHRIDRFLAPVIPALCVMAGASADICTKRLDLVKWTAIVSFVVTVVFLIAAVHIAGGTLQVASGIKREEDWLRETTEGKTFSMKALEAMNNLPDKTRTLLLGEAQVYYFDKPIVYSVVFNDDIIEGLIAGETEDAHGRLRRAGVTHVFINWSEFARLRRTYAYDYRGSTRPGYLPHMSDYELQRFLMSLEPVSEWGGRSRSNEHRPGHRPWELYAVPEIVR